MAVFSGIEWYIGIELDFSLFVLFKQWWGLYFWSCAVGSWGVILQPLFIGNDIPGLFLCPDTNYAQSLVRASGIQPHVKPARQVYYHVSMGLTEGFDMVPRLGTNSEDTLKWRFFLEIVQKQFAGDEQVKVHEHYVEFEAGEHPTLPFHGPHFLRFSSKVTGPYAYQTGVDAYIHFVRRLAIQVFESRIRPWSEAFDQYGFYEWSDVYDSLNSAEAGDTKLASGRFANITGEDADNPPRSMKENLYEVMEIPERGRGLVARYSIKRGTRILCEKPLFVVVPSESPEALNEVVACQLKELSKAQQMQVLSLHNNFPGKHAFSGIVRTNALPCGPGAQTGGVYPTICRINHSCRPNCHNSWNEATEMETIHATRDIFAGEELFISYDEGGAYETRQQELKANFGFNCICELCSAQANDRTASDERRVLIQSLDKQIGNPMTMMSRPLLSLHACHALLGTLKDEYPDPSTGGATATALVPRLYYDALQIVVAHGDQARARIFAERAYEARVECEGEDSPATQKVKQLMQDPSLHASFGACGKNWRTSKTAQPNKKKIGEEAFEKWLWRL